MCNEHCAAGLAEAEVHPYFSPADHVSVYFLENRGENRFLYDPVQSQITTANGHKLAERMK